MDREPFARDHARLRDHRAIGGREPATQRGRRREVERVGQRDQVGIGITKRDQFRKRTPMRKSRLLLSRAHLLIARNAFATRATATDKR